MSRLVDQQKAAPAGKVRIGAALPKETVKAARSFAGWRGLTLGDVVDAALQEYLRRHLPKAE